MGANASLLLLIQFAYAAHDNPMSGHSLTLPTSQVVGGPAWINSEGYDIEAKPRANTDSKQIWPMWQTLVADRFKPRLHRETRELPIYSLTVVKGGPKTRLIEFGRFAAERRKKRGEGKPETFNFLGFTHICGTDHQGHFTVRRTTIGKRLRWLLRRRA
jgi:uncharacterized protein (TIGR03435 family)